MNNTIRNLLIGAGSILEIMPPRRRVDLNTLRANIARRIASAEAGTASDISEEQRLQEEREAQFEKEVQRMRVLVEPSGVLDEASARNVLEKIGTVDSIGSILWAIWLVDNMMTLDSSEELQAQLKTTKEQLMDRAWNKFGNDIRSWLNHEAY
ncbi:MAG: hypothetical protein ACOX5Z_11875 [Desulfobulbus sp.]|jgi:hypothetical protein